MTFILIFLLLIVSTVGIFYFIKYNKLKKSIKSYESIAIGRYGFYISSPNSSSFKANVYVKEIDRYSSGYSKIKIDRIEPYHSLYYDSVISSITGELKLTSEIEWLESEDHLRRLRKEKLENLKKI